MIPLRTGHDDVGDVARREIPPRSQLATVIELAEAEIAA